MNHAGDFLAVGRAADDQPFAADGIAGGLQAIQVLDCGFDLDNNIGQSLAVNPAADDVSLVRLNTVQTEGVAFEISADGGASWKSITPDWTWTSLPPLTDILSGRSFSRVQPSAQNKVR